MVFVACDSATLGVDFDCWICPSCLHSHHKWKNPCLWEVGAGVLEERGDYVIERGLCDSLLAWGGQIHIFQWN